MTSEMGKAAGGELSAAINSGAMALVQDVHRIENVAARLQLLAERLEAFSFPEVARTLGALLTRTETHSATVRIEALAHLAALYCKGQGAPSRQELQTWLDAMLEDQITQFEDPIEDVVVSRVFADFGNARLLMGLWNANDEYVQSCVSVLNSSHGVRALVPIRRQVMAMLRLSEAVAERAGLSPNTLSESAPGEALDLDSLSDGSSADWVSFSEADLFSLGVSSAAIEPFVFRPEDAAALKVETLGHTAFERRPLVRCNGDTIVALPTAIGAAIRRFVVEQADEAGVLDVLQSRLAELQFNQVYERGCREWGMHPMDIPTPAAPAPMADLVGSFDTGSYFHLIFVPDDLSEAAAQGLRGVQDLEQAVTERVAVCMAALSDRPDYRRGLTVLVHGGLGRGFHLTLGTVPDAWHVLALPLSDFMLLGWDSDMYLPRAWKLLEQEERLSSRGITLVNGGGFPNLYAFAQECEFQLVPDYFGRGSVTLSTGLVAELRGRVRRALDRHIALAPDNESWVEVQRESTTPFLDNREHPLYVSLGHALAESVLASVETAVRPWWVRCDPLPEDPRGRDVAILISEMVRAWLLRLAPVLEERIPTLPSGPVAYALRFPGIEGLTDEFLLAGGDRQGPTIGREGDRTVTVDCAQPYLRSFVERENVGDRLMVEALIRGAYMLGGLPPPEAGTLAEIVDAVVGSADARFVHFPIGRWCREQIEAKVPFPSARTLTEEDLAWSRLGLAHEVDSGRPPGPLSEGEAPAFLHRAVDVIWARIRTRLSSLNRVSTIERSLLNFGAICKERSDWSVAAAALRTTLDDSELALAAWSKKEREVHLAGVCCRVVAEMALCTCPAVGGVECGDIDLDSLIAEIAVLLEWSCPVFVDGLCLGNQAASR